MCVGLWTTKHPDYALILLNNRDEFLARPTKPATIHHFGNKLKENDPNEGGEIISGLDTKAGGTWLGINRHGRIAMLTNITEEARKRNTSRGDLVSSFLLSSTQQTMEQYIEELINLEDMTEQERLTHRNYAGFNLLLISLAAEDEESPSKAAPEPTTISGIRRPRMALVTNSGGGGPLTARWLTGQEVDLSGVSNGIDQSTMHLWIKITRGQEDLGELVAKDGQRDRNEREAELLEDLFRILETHPSQRPTQRDDLRGAMCVDPMDVDIGAGIKGFYGTRLSTVILIRRDGSVVYRERDVWKMLKSGDRNGLAGLEPDSAPVPVIGNPKEDRILGFQLYA